VKWIGSNTDMTTDPRPGSPETTCESEQRSCGRPYSTENCLHHRPTTCARPIDDAGIRAIAPGGAGSPADDMPRLLEPHQLGAVRNAR